MAIKKSQIKVMKCTQFNKKLHCYLNILGPEEVFFHGSNWGQEEFLKKLTLI